MRPITVTTTDASGGTKNSAAILVDHHGKPQISLQVVVTGSATYTVQQSLNDPYDATQTTTWFSHPDTALVAATTNQQGNYAYVPLQIRLQQTAGAGSATLTVLQAGEANG
jgi:hypothetical protein